MQQNFTDSKEEFKGSLFDYPFDGSVEQAQLFFIWLIAAQFSCD